LKIVLPHILPVSQAQLTVWLCIIALYLRVVSFSIAALHRIFVLNFLVMTVVILLAQQTC